MDMVLSNAHTGEPNKVPPQRQILQGVRVLDFGRYIAGPYCASLLGDLGAEVIRVDRIGGSEDRFVVPLAGSEGGAMFLQCNRNKLSITLDPSSDDGRDIIRQLTARADVVVANLPPSTLLRLGLDYQTLKTRKNDIILTTVNTFGSQGPWSDRVGFDAVAQAMCGLAYLTGHPGDPQKSYGSWADFLTAALAAFGTLGAVLWRNQTGEGQHVEGSLLASALTVASPTLIEQAVTQIDRTATGNRSQTVGPADIFETADGWVVVQVVGDGAFRRWCALIGEDEWYGDERFKDDAARGGNGKLLSRRMAEWCRARSTRDALAELERARLPAGPTLSPRAVLDNEQVQGMGALHDINYPGIDGAVPIIDFPLKMTAGSPGVRAPAPTIGQHTGMVLRALGYTDEDIAAFRAAGTI
jgi:crotonobetainyl-CoA:carnitine CoA-transferase CaiB-like acyl-CoA transferase